MSKPEHAIDWKINKKYLVIDLLPDGKVVNSIYKEFESAADKAWWIGADARPVVTQLMVLEESNSPMRAYEPKERWAVLVDVNHETN